MRAVIFILGVASIGAQNSFYPLGTGQRNSPLLPNLHRPQGDAVPQPRPTEPFAPEEAEEEEVKAPIMRQVVDQPTIVLIPSPDNGTCYLSRSTEVSLNGEYKKDLAPQKIVKSSASRADLAKLSPSIAEACAGKQIHWLTPAPPGTKTIRRRPKRQLYYANTCASCCCPTYVYTCYVCYSCSCGCGIYGK